MNKENKENLIPVKGLSPFKRFCMTIGELPSSYLETMTYYEMLVWFTKYMQDTVIPTINNNASAVDELQDKYIEFTDNLLDRQTTFENNLTTRQENYEEEVMTLFNNLQDFVNNYFNNLDVQEEINNKLDQMVEDGILQEIIADYLNSKAIFGFDNVTSMKQATNLINGSYARTLGYYNKNDGGSALYKIRTITNDDVVDEMFIIEMSTDNTLIAELITLNEINLCQVGLKGDGLNDDTTKFNNALNYARNNNIKITSPKNKEYLISSSLNISNITMDLNYSTIKTSENIDILTLNSTDYYTEIKNININCNGVANSGIKITQGRKSTIENINIKNVLTYGIHYVSGYENYFNNLHITGLSTADATGIYAQSGDSYINNIIIIDCKTAINNLNGFNIYSNVHGWILTKELISGSIYLKCSGGKLILNNCYSDTYQYAIWQYTQIPILILNNFTNLYNHGIYTEEIATNNQPYFMYCESGSGNALTRINTSILDGYSSTIKTLLTNLTSFDGDIVNSIIRDHDHNIPFTQLETSSNTSGVTINYSNLEKTDKCVYLNERATMDATNTKSFVIGTIPYYYRDREYIGMASYGTGQYNHKGTCYLYISNTGNITVTLPDDVTGNVTVKVNISYIIHKEQ